MLLGQTKHKERSRPIDTQKSSQNPKKIPNEELYINYYLQNSKAMSKLLKKDHSPLKFDTSSANINCFIRPPSKQKQDDHNHHLKNHKHKQKACNQSQKQTEFQDKAFLESVVSKILTEADCPGITELIDNMVFPSTNSGQAEASRDNRREQLQQQQISQIFSNHYPFNRVNYPQKANLFEQSSHFYRINPSQYHTYRDEKPEMTTTVQTSFNSHSPSSRNLDTNPETEMFNAMNSNLPIGYPYSYYPQLNYLYQRQQSSRKRRVVTGQQANEYRIIPEKIQSDFRTTLMIRHIPNKYSQDMLLEQIGKNHRMHINFLYLPIDHSNACNVGYAFANFIHAKFIFEFYQEFNGRRWDRFNSEKICQLAYARIQGTTNLMDHFQNSSNGQLRGRTLSKGEEKKKTAVELDENAIKGITEIVSHQRVEYN